MSKYSQNIGNAIIKALEPVPSAQPAQVAGYWVNRNFWVSEFKHFLNVEADYERRVGLMKREYDEYIREHGGPHNLDSIIYEPRQEVVKTTSNADRRRVAGHVRSALKQLAERAFNLRIADTEQYDLFLETIKISN